jgi:alpha-L-fucosidase 2
MNFPPRGMRQIPIAILLSWLISSAQGADTVVRDAVDWPVFLGRSDPLFEQLPQQWNEGAFAGNGNMGFVAYADLDANGLAFHLGRMDVTDHRKAPDDKTSMDVNGTSVMFDFPRLAIGRMMLRPAGRITGGTMRQDLWNAEVTGTITTDLGELKFRALTLRDNMVTVVEVTSTEDSAGGKPAEARWEFLPGNSSSPRAITSPDQAQKLGYEPNPPPEIRKLDGVSVCVTRLLAGGDFATAWLEQPSSEARESALYVSTANEIPAAGASAPRAVAEVKAAAQAPLDRLVDAHRRWWHDYYRRSFLTLPDGRIESFYWIQMYKLGSSLRAGGPALDVLGPFYRTTMWPGIWWNLNIQLSYWPVYAGNRLELGETLTDLLDERFEGIFARFRNRPNLGDFAWVMHNYWWQMQFAGDWRGLQERWMPKAKKVFDSYRTMLEPRDNGQLGLKPMGSPEYDGFAPFPDTNYNLALLRWLLGAMLECDARTGQAPDPEAEEWRETLGRLIPYPIDENGLRIASNQALEESHRHYSHLLALYPLYQFDPDDPANRDLVVKSVKHWHSIDGGDKLTGYSLTGAASLFASLGLGDEAAAELTKFLTSNPGRSQLHANTFYTESGGRNPVIETPLSAASATMDLLLQSWGGQIRVFPAVPDSWQEASFRDLRAAGGFLVGATRENGRTAWVSIRSEAGEPCVLKVRDWSGALATQGDRTFAIEEISPGEYRIDLPKGEEIVVFPEGRQTEPVMASVQSADRAANPYGVKRGGEIKTKQFWPEPTTP